MFDVKSIGENVIKLSGRVDSSNAAAVEEKVFSLCSNGEVILDFEDLKYISSAGLRVLLKLRKKCGEVTAVNVSSDVYEILDVTGFTSIINVKKALRSIDITGCKRIGAGGNGTVYRLDDETIVKVFRPGIPLAEIEKERAFAKAAFVAGIPTAIPFDLVKVGDAYGNVYELMNSDTLAHALLTQPERRAELMDKYVALVKQLAQIHVDNGAFCSYKSLMMERCEGLQSVFGSEYADLIKEILSSLRDTDTTLVHGDLHPGNIMLQGDELMLIDMADMTYGSPILEIVAIYRDMGAPMEPEVAKINAEHIGMDVDSVNQTWNDFAVRYYGTDDKEILEQQLGPVKLLFAFFAPIEMMLSPADLQKQIAPLVIRQIVEPVIVPNKETIKYLLSAM